MEYEVIIIGAGPAALTAALYLKRCQRKILIVAENIGGQAALAGKVENVPGLIGITGAQIIQKQQSQIEPYHIEIKREKVREIKKVESGFEVICAQSKFKAASVLLATGRRHRELGLDNEKSLVGKGLSYCATCDGPFSNNKDTIVIGGGNAATEAALFIAKIAKSVTLLNLSKEICCEKVTLEKVAANPKIKVINQAKIKQIIIKDRLIKAVIFDDIPSMKTISLPAQMVFVEIGQVANSENFKKLVRQNNNNEIEIDSNNMTSEAGIFAAGDVTNVLAKQIVVAWGEGAKAALAIDRYLEKQI